MIPEGISNGARAAFARSEREKIAAKRAKLAAEDRAQVAEAAIERLTAAMDRLAARLDAIERDRAVPRTRRPAKQKLVAAAAAPHDRVDVIWRVKPIAAFLGLSEKAAQHRIDKGEIPTFRIGGTICARRSTLITWLSEQETAAQEGR